MKTKTVKNLLVLVALMVSAGALNACALCHGFDNHNAKEMRDRFWDHSNMQW